MNQETHPGPLGEPGPQAGASQRPRAGLEARGHSSVGQAGAQPLGIRASGTLQPTRGADTGDPGRHPRHLFPLYRC